MTTKLARVVFALFVTLFLGVLASAEDWPQWRGPQRDGVSKETGLLKEWPKDGPKLAWKVDDLGDGYGTPAVVGGRLYLVTNQGTETESVVARDAKDGKPIWSTKIGSVGNPDQQPAYPGARSTPTIDGEFIYAMGSDGDLACLTLADGKVKWQKNVRKEFGGKPGIWAYSESPLVDGEGVVVTPGGADATMVKLDKKSGDVIWKSPLPEADNAAYSSAIVVEAAGARQYVQLMQKGLVGIDPKSGKLLWRYQKPVSRFDANIPTPTAGDGLVYTGSAGTGGGTVKLVVKDGAIEPEEVYFEARYPTAIGGTIKLGEHLYGTTSQALLCIELKTGEIKWTNRSIGAASMCYADGRLYLHGENGQVALVEASPAEYKELGKFTPADLPKRANSMAKAWAFPVVANGRLYVRDLNMLWCYEVK